MTKQIASIYFSKLEEIRRPSYQGIFSVPVAPKGAAPVVITIKDHFEHNDQPFFAGTTPNGKPFKVRVTIPGEQIADDVLAHWTKHHPEMTPHCAPGMWVVRDIVYLWGDDDKPMLDAEGRQESRPATTAEKEAMFAEDLAAAMERQNAWCEKAITKGDIMSDKPAAIEYIPQYCRDSVDYAGRERGWRKGLHVGDVRSCPACTKSISSAAFKCPSCSEIIDPVKYADFKARMEAATAEAQARIAGSKAPMVPPVKNPQQPVAAR